MVFAIMTTMSVMVVAIIIIIWNRSAVVAKVEALLRGVVAVEAGHFWGPLIATEIVISIVIKLIKMIRMRGCCD